MSIAQNIVQLKTSLPQGVTLVAVSKFHPVEALWEATNDVRDRTERQAKSTT